MAKGVLVKPALIEWAIRSSGKSIIQLSEKFGDINKWTVTENDFTVSELNRLSKELKIPFGYFFLDEPPIEEIRLLEYRTIENTENKQLSRDLIDTIKTMEIRQDFMKEALIEDGYLPLQFVGSAKLKDDTKQLALRIKEELGLKANWNKESSNPFRTLRKAVSNSGILVMQNGVVGSNNTRSLDLGEFRAFVLIDEYVPLIFLNAKDSQSAKLFSLCHELVHIWLGIDELYNDTFETAQMYSNEKLEAFCNEVAAEITLPHENLISSFDKKGNIYESIEIISKEYGLSELVVCIRLKNTQMIDKETFNVVYPKLLEKMKESLARIKYQQDKKGGSYYNTAGSRLDPRFVNCVNRKAKENRILYSQAYRLIGAKGNTYDKLIEHMEGM